MVHICPNRASCLRLISALAMENSEEWLTGCRFLLMESLEEKSIPVEILEPIMPEVVPALLRYLGSYSHYGDGVSVEMEPGVFSAVA